VFTHPAFYVLHPSPALARRCLHYTQMAGTVNGGCAYALRVYDAPMIEMRIAELLEERGQTVYWLAKESGIRYSTVHDLSRGRWKSVRREVIDSLCAALKCTPGDLIERTGAAKRAKAKRKSKQPM
jgi:putative transcriptional regulator